MKEDCTSILYQVQKGIGAKETIVEKLTESQKMNTKSDSKVTSVNLLSQSKKCLFSWFHIMKYRMVYFPWVILDQSIWGLWWAMVQLCADHLALRNHCLQNTPGEFPLTERIEGIIVKLSSWPSEMISYKDMTKIEMTSSRWQYWVELDTFLDIRKHPGINIFRIFNRNMQILNLFCWFCLSENAWYDNVQAVGYNWGL